MRIPVITVLCLCVMTASVAAAAGPVVLRSGTPQAPPRTVTLVPEWSAGGEDSDIIFGMMIDCLDDANGNVYLLDSQLGHVQVFSAVGEHLRTISGQGEGPGEVQIPQSVLIMPDGNLGILELFPAHLVVLGLDGTPLDSPAWGSADDSQTGFVFGVHGACDGGTLLVAAQHSGARVEGKQERTQFVCGLDPAGKELVRFREETITFDFTDPRIVEADILPHFLSTNTVGPDGRVYMARGRNEYAIEVLEGDGTPVHVIEREFVPRRRSDDEFRRLNAVIDVWTAGMSGEIPRDLEETEPVITDLQVDDEGVLWVQHHRSGTDVPDDVLFKYDTFTPAGSWLREVHVKANGNPDYDGIKFLDGDHALVIRGYVLARWASRGAQNVDFGQDEMADMEVVYCRIEDG